MDRRTILAPLALGLALTSLPGCNGDDDTETRRVRILATTDEHSHLLAVGPERDEWPLASTANAGDPKLLGGVARRATVLDRERADGIPTVLLSNGDFSQGTLSAVAYTVANFDVMLMRELGYDAIALGNHEFDSLPSGLVAAIAAAKGMGGAPPFVLTNAIFDDTTPAGDGDDALKVIYGGVGSGKDVVSGLIVDKAGVKVGVVSAMSPSAAYDVQYQAAPVTFSTADLGAAYPAYVDAATGSIAALLQPVVDQLRAGGAQVVVLLFHGGLASTGTNGDLDGLVPLLRGVDLVVGGHTHGVPDGTELIADADGRDVPVMQAKPYGNELLRAEFTIGDGRARFDAGRSTFLPVDDRTLPTTDPGIRAGLATAIGAVESSLLGPTLSGIVGREIVDNPVHDGDLYFFPLGTTTFDVTGATLRAETNALNLDTDAMLAVTKSLGYTAEVALQNSGSIRGDLLRGETGTLAFADVFRMVSLGADPYDDPAGPGYPLVRVYIQAMALRAAFEQTLQMAYLNNDYYLGSAGLAIDWDPSRSACATPTTCALAGGWITSLQLLDGATDPVLYDPVAFETTGGWAGTAVPALGGAGSEALRMVPVVTTLLVASFAGNMDVVLYDEAGEPVTDLSTRVVEWTGPGTPDPLVPNVRDHQALAAYIYNALGGVMPAAYGAVMPARSVCSRATGDNPQYPCPYP